MQCSAVALLLPATGTTRPLLPLLCLRALLLPALGLGCLCGSRRRREGENYIYKEITRAANIQSIK